MLDTERTRGGSGKKNVTKLLICGETARVNDTAATVGWFYRGHPFREIARMKSLGVWPEAIQVQVFIPGIGLMDETTSVIELVRADRPHWQDQVTARLAKLAPYEIFLFLTQTQDRLLSPYLMGLSVKIIRPTGSPGQRMGQLVDWLEHASTAI